MKASIQRNDESLLSATLVHRGNQYKSTYEPRKLKYDDTLTAPHVLGVRCPETPYQAYKKLEQWFRDIPVEFPSHIDMTDGMPSFFNPMVGEDYKETCRNVINVMEAMKKLALSPDPGRADFVLTEEGAQGLLKLLDCMTSALRFERNYRNNDYETPSC